MSVTAAKRWYDEHVDGEISIATFLQLFSDKYKASMKESGLTFYLLQVNVMNFSRNIKHRMKKAVHSIVAYIPVQLFRHTFFGNIDDNEYIFRINKLGTHIMW